MLGLIEPAPRARACPGHDSNPRSRRDGEISAFAFASAASIREFLCFELHGGKRAPNRYLFWHGHRAGGGPLKDRDRPRVYDGRSIQGPPVRVAVTMPRSMDVVRASSTMSSRSRSHRRGGRNSAAFVPQPCSGTRVTFFRRAHAVRREQESARPGQARTSQRKRAGPGITTAYEIPAPQLRDDVAHQWRTCSVEQRDMRHRFANHRVDPSRIRSTPRLLGRARSGRCATIRRA